MPSTGPAVTPARKPPREFSLAAKWALSIAFVAAVAIVIAGLFLLGKVAPTLRANHKGFGRAQCTVCHLPSKTHAGSGFTPDMCPECHGPNGAPRTAAKHPGWKRADCLASGCHDPAKVHAGVGFTVKSCRLCHGANGLPLPEGAAR